MKTFLDMIEDKSKREGKIEGKREGKREGKLEGKLETIQTIASLRFPEPSKRLTSLLTKFNDLKLLDQIRLFALTAPSLFDVENFVENLTRANPKAKRVVKGRTA